MIRDWAVLSLESGVLSLESGVLSLESLVGSLESLRRPARRGVSICHVIKGILPALSLKV